MARKKQITQAVIGYCRVSTEDQPDARRARHRKELVHENLAARVSGTREGCKQRTRCDSRGPDQGSAGNRLAACEVHLSRCGGSDLGFKNDLDSVLAKLSSRVRP